MLGLRGSRLLAIAGLALIGFLYWKPAHTYLSTRRQLQAAQAQVQSLRDERTTLQREISRAGAGEQFVREARKLGLVKQGERLFIVKGIAAWRKHHHQ